MLLTVRLTRSAVVLFDEVGRPARIDRWRPSSLDSLDSLVSKGRGGSSSLDSLESESRSCEWLSRVTEPWSLSRYLRLHR